MLGFMNFFDKNLTRDDVETLINTGAFWMEEKLDGIRLRINQTSKGQIAYTTKNKTYPASKFPRLTEQFQDLWGEGLWCVEGELTSSYGFNDVQAAVARGNNLPEHERPLTFNPFDLLATSYFRELYKEPLRLRRTNLETVCRNHGVTPVMQKTIPLEMMDWYDKLDKQKREGVVLKKWNDPYALAGAHWYRSKFVQSVTVYPVDICDESLMVQCAMIDEAGAFRHVCDVQVDMEDMLTLLNHMGDPTAEIWPALEVNVYGIDSKGNLRHPVYKGLRFETDAGACATKQLTTLRKV